MNDHQQQHAPTDGTPKPPPPTPATLMQPHRPLALSLTPPLALRVTRQRKPTAL